RMLLARLKGSARWLCRALPHNRSFLTINLNCRGSMGETALPRGWKANSLRLLKGSRQRADHRQTVNLKENQGWWYRTFSLISPVSWMMLPWLNPCIPTNLTTPLHNYYFKPAGRDWEDPVWVLG